MIRILIDTQALIWFALDDASLSSSARSLILDPSNERSVSLASIWEMAIKIARGKLDLVSNLRGSTALNTFVNFLPANDIALLPIVAEDAIGVSDFPYYVDHKDPFDRLIAAQCLRHDLTLISVDQAFDRYGVRRAW